VLAVAGAGVILLAAVTRSNELAAHAATRSDSPEQREPAKPVPPPKLPAAKRSERLYRTVIIPSTDAAESCARGARTLVISALNVQTVKKVGDKLYPIDMTPEVEALLERVGARAATDCEGQTVPEIYMICEGTFDDVMAGTVSCYPHDPFLL